MSLRNCHLLRTSRSLLLLLALSSLPVFAGRTAVLDSLVVSPGVVSEGDKREDLVQTVVTLKAPSPNYFVCEIRSEERRRVDCGTIIFKKGDTQGAGSGVIHWDNVTINTKIKLTAFSTDTPDTVVTFTLSLKKKTDASDTDSP